MHSPMQENHIAEAAHKDTANKKKLSPAQFVILQNDDMPCAIYY